ncbi:PKD domain-containing protein [Lentimicrobium sp.]|uniref:PKD domain-containing protein n=1 Tax=Lentimicrobium sp. TaxID=2034841 RepID=UPI002BF903D0|nr:PKD domain-containing protein [Lentimicrobium sp.]HPR27434.1 PKD domain-containing protein [Lentimicrobium sp.]
MRRNLLSFFLLLNLIPFLSFAQNYTIQSESGRLHPTLITTSEPVILVKSIADQLSSGEFIPAVDIQKEVNPKRWGTNTSVPGKGLPKGNDPLFESQRATGTKSPGRLPLLTFEAASAGSTPTDPTGAVGPNHFVNSWNSSFRIWDKTGNPLTSPASLGTLFPGTMGDPIVIYDRYADRFLITEFFSNGFDVAICQGPDPVNDGWYVYRFNTNTFPDYPKFSVWSDGYYITANKDQSSASTSQVVFALDRNKMLTGDLTAQMLGFPLTGIVTSGFYSPLGFNCNGPTLPPPGNAPIVYMQDDSWSGVSTDHLKIWNVNVDWTTPASSTISAPQIINTAAFDGLFDGGSFSNLPQPSGSDIDALQATIMYMAQYRRFSGHNSVVFNFVVDLDGNDDYSGIRWYELRQTADGAPWSIFQEGTYAQPDGHSAFCGNMCMDANGNIGLAYTTVSSTIFPALRYTGRLATDPPGIMTMAEQVIFNGTQRDPASRYGDYAQMTIDPNDDATFWSIGEVFTGSARKSYVGVFQFAPPALSAAFSADAVTVCAGSSLTFTDESIPQPTSWSWSFPGGTPSSSDLENPPPITYAITGTYDVSLTVSNGTETDTETKTAYITAIDLIADFAASATTVIEGNSVIFTDLSSCGPTTWQWSFPGGTPASFNGQNPPAITYAAAGNYDVTLIASKPGATDTKTRTAYITVTPPVFNITNGSVTTCAGSFYDSGGPSGNYANNENYTFTFYPGTPGAMIRADFSAFNIESGYDFLSIYDGINTSAPLIGTYSGTTNPGTFTAGNGSGALTFNFTSDNSLTPSGWAAAINCYSTAVPPVADFAASSTTPAINEKVNFTDLSTNAPTSWAWSFSPGSVVYVNGTSANSQNPEVQFTSTGQYSVTLTATNASGPDSEIKANYIDVQSFVYCIPEYSSGTSSGDYISLVQLGSINNATGASANPYYTYYSSLTTDLLQGASYTITLSPGTYSSGNNISVWIDYNRNGTFETSEKLGNVDIPSTPATGTIIFSIPETAVIGTTRMRVREVWNNSNFDPCNNYSYGETEDYNVNILPSERNLTLTLFLEGLFNGVDLNKAKGISGDQYPGAVADHITLELHDASPPYALAGGPYIVEVLTDGTANVTLPASLGESYYIVIKHRNSIETWNATPLSFDQMSLSYNFSSSASQAFGNNLKPASGKYLIFGGDVNQDGSIDSGDMTPVDNDAANFISGYLSSDANGDGTVDTSDMTIVDNNASVFVGKITP